MSTRTLLSFALIALLLSACGGAPEPTLDPNAIMTVAFATVNAAGTQTALAMPTNIPTPTNTESPSVPAWFPTNEPFSPTAILSVTVIVPAVNCRFGPDTVYVAPYGLRNGKTREAIGRNLTGDWLLVREPDGQKACWVSTPTVSVQGDPATLAVAPVRLQFTSQYPPPQNLKSERNGSQIQIAWDDVPLQIRDIYPDNHYLLDVWVCNSGQLIHQLVGTNDLGVKLTDETSCSDASYGLIYTATKAGYSFPAPIPWH